jgi:HSP90 family molecular chaperone
MKAMGQPVPMSVQDLQINANHPMVQTIIKNYTADKDKTLLEKYVTYLYESALLLQGRDVTNMANFIKTTNTLISQSSTN